MITRQAPSSSARRRHPGALALVVAVLAALAPTLGLDGPARAAEGSLCTGPGVNVIVDFKALGGGVQQTCDEKGAGKVASEVFKESGFELTPVGAFPGAACRVDGKPADAACAQMPPADAYWGLYLAKGGSWDYAPKGADELKLADGAFVGFAWQGSKKSSPPAVAPQTPTAAPSQDASAAASQGTDSSAEQDSGNGIPWWVPTGVIVVLAAVAVLAAARRRRATGS